MISASDRENAVMLIDEAVHSRARRCKACEEIGIKERTYYRWTKQMNITLRQSRLSGVARATFPDKQSHLVINYCIMF